MSFPKIYNINLPPPFPPLREHPQAVTLGDPRQPWQSPPMLSNHFLVLARKVCNGYSSKIERSIECLRNNYGTHKLLKILTWVTLFS
jgi:hypothetical protein